MTYERIKQLLKLVKDDSSYWNMAGGMMASGLDTTARFTVAYRDLAFGYHFVLACKRDGHKRLPPQVIEPAMVSLWKCLTSKHIDESVVFAMSLMDPKNKIMEDSIRGMLLSGAPISSISELTGLPNKHIQSYEQLLFNVRDRLREALFIASIVYPEGKGVELRPDYGNTEDWGRIVIRSGYNNGLLDCAKMAGLKVDGFSSDGLSASDAASRLETQVMANAVFLATNGFLNTQSMGVGQGKSLLAAAKAGGQQSPDSAGAMVQTLGATALLTMREIVGSDSLRLREMNRKVLISEDKKLSLPGSGPTPTKVVNP